METRTRRSAGGAAGGLNSATIPLLHVQRLKDELKQRGFLF